MSHLQDGIKPFHIYSEPLFSQSTLLATPCAEQIALGLDPGLCVLGPLCLGGLFFLIRQEAFRK